MFKTSVGPATAAAHSAAIETLVRAKTPATFGRALNAFRDLRVGAPAGTSPGVSWEAEDGNYWNGHLFFTKVGDELASTAVDHLPPRTFELWAKLDQLQREQVEIRNLVHTAKADRDGPGQPPIGPPTPVRLPTWLIAVLDTEAAEEGISRARHIRNLILEARAARADGKKQ